MEKEKTNAEVYPHNLLIAIKGQPDREIPNSLRDDHLAGSCYVLSLPRERERGILIQRYRDGKQLPDLAVVPPAVQISFVFLELYRLRRYKSI